MFDTLKTNYVLHWSNNVEEFSPTLHYIGGPHNILADIFAQLHRLVTWAQIMEEKSLVDPAVVSNDEDELSSWNKSMQVSMMMQYDRCLSAILILIVIH